MTRPAASADGTDPQLSTVQDGLAAQLRGAPGARGGVTDLTDGPSKRDPAMERIVGALGTLGARPKRVEPIVSEAEVHGITVTDSLSEAERIESTKTLVDWQLQEVTCTSPRGATEHAVQPSLLDFLR